MQSIENLISQLQSLREEMVAVEQAASDLLIPIAEEHQCSARNLLHYATLRRHDIRELQECLVPLGLSSLGRCEAYVMANLEAVLENARKLFQPASLACTPTAAEATDSAAPIEYSEARELLRRRSEQLFGVDENRPAIMVTMAAEAATDARLVGDLLDAGMTVMRINCAHDSPSLWRQMINNLHDCQRDSGATCRIAMDLAGPKIRTVVANDKILVYPNDCLLLSLEPLAPSALAGLASAGLASAGQSQRKIACTLPEAFRAVQIGDRMLFDDGKVTCVVEQRTDKFLIVRALRAKKKGQKLRSDRGINLPDTKIDLPALTDKDRRDLEFVVKHADLINYSFVRRADDMLQLRSELQRVGKPDMPIIIKVENAQSFENLADILLHAMRSNAPIGVMIARGDLAVECGWERLVEVQEEILWMCEAAHVPVVWATQVLEGLAKKGLPTRAEITDAGAGSRAECVMLNKGPNIVETVASLHDILSRMHEHQTKKRPTFRRLTVADRFLSRA